MRLLTSQASLALLQVPAVLAVASGAEACEDHSLLQLGSGLGCPPVPQVSCQNTLGTMHNGPTAGMKKMSKAMPDVAITPAHCPLCSTPGATAALYSIERFDGMGQRAAHLIVMMALANHLGLNFGGLLPHPSTEVHGADVHACLSAVVGTDYTALRKRVRHASFDTCFFGSHVLLSTLGGGNQTVAPVGRNVLFQECGFGKDIVGFLTPDFLEKLRKHTLLLTQPTPYFLQDKRALRVAVHVRRGDIDVSRQTNRDVPNNVYLQVARAIKEMAHGLTDIHVFSTTKEGTHASSDFEAFEAAGMTVHLNGDELGDLAHMAQADVLVQAPSSFSWVAGVLNSNCVVSFKSYPGGLESWFYHHSGSFKSQDAKHLSQCIQHRLQTARL